MILYLVGSITYSVITLGFPTTLSVITFGFAETLSVIILGFTETYSVLISAFANKSDIFPDCCIIPSTYVSHNINYYAANKVNSLYIICNFNPLF